jgi:hypothetical protein
MKISYKIKEVKDRIYSVVIKDDYDRAMTFCRVEEFYESPNRKFRGKSYSIWDYMKWYSQEFGGFTYAKDWVGFNVHLKSAVKCYERVKEDLTPYDKTMKEILGRIKIDMVLSKKNDRDLNAYIIASEDTKGETFRHEMCHALYSLDKKYKKEMDELNSSMNQNHYKIFSDNLIEMGYDIKVVPDEIQAYLSTTKDHNRFYKGIKSSIIEGYHKKYSEILKNY